MAPTSTALTTKVSTGSPYQLDQGQTLKASKALLKHIKSEQQKAHSQSGKRNLLAVSNDDDQEDDEAADAEDVPIWLVLTTKKHMTDKKRLKPGKITIPHSLNVSPTSTVCLITADPQRRFKDAVAHPAFPESLRNRISRVIGASKLRTKYKAYESRRQLRSEYDIFLADDRVITLLPNLLGKEFYQVGAKRPVPVNIAGPQKSKGSTARKAKDDEKSIAEPKAMAHEISRTLSTALVYLSPSTCTSVRVGKASWDADKVAQNVEAVVDGLVEKFVPKKWRGVRAIHVKGPNTAALPVWLADELWVDETDVLDEAPITEGEPVKAIEAPTKNRRKRKAGEVEGDKPSKETKKAKKVQTEDGADLVKENKLREENLARQKAEAAADGPGGVLASISATATTKKAKKAKKSKSKASDFM